MMAGRWKISGGDGHPERISLDSQCGCAKSFFVLWAADRQTREDACGLRVENKIKMKGGQKSEWIMLMMADRQETKPPKKDRVVPCSTLHGIWRWDVVEWSDFWERGRGVTLKVEEQLRPAATPEPWNGE